MAYAVLDIDGVVSDPGGRLALLDSGAPDKWERFFAAAAHDALLPEGAAVARELAEDHEIVWLTGRPEKWRGPTQAWLDDHGLPPGELSMQADGDNRSAYVTKLERLQQLRRTVEIALVVDDDPRVIEALRPTGIPFRHADWHRWRPAGDQQAPGSPRA